MNPIKTKNIKFKKCSILNDRNFIAIDLGFSVTKFLFVNKENSDDFNNEKVNHVTLQFASFSTQDIENSLRWLKINCFLSKEKLYHIQGTGVRFFQHRNLIESILELKIDFVKEDLAQIHGFTLAMDQVGIENLAFARPSCDDFPKAFGGIIQKIGDGLKNRLDAKIDKNNNFQSCLVVFCDEDSRYFYFDGNRVGKEIYFLENLSKTFLGLAKCLLDKNNYEQIVDLARNGDRCKVDTQIKEIFGAAIDNAYGKYNPDMPVFPFGKIGDLNIDQGFSKEDLAISLIVFISTIIFTQCYQFCIHMGIKQVYLGGYLIRSELFHKEIEKRNKRYSMEINLEYLDFEFCSVLGAMLSDWTHEN